MAVSPLAAGIVGVTFSQVRELIARRWVVVAVVVLALVALGQKSESTPEPLLASSAQMALGATSEFRLWFPVVAGCFVALGATAFVLATDRVAARVFLGFATAAAAALLAATATPAGEIWALETEYVALAAVGASAPLLFLVFPVNRLSSRAGRRVVATCVSAHAALVALSCGLLVLQLWPLFYALLTVLLMVLAADLLAAIGLAVGVMVVAPPRGGRERSLLGIVALGTIAGLAPFPLFVLAPRLTSDTYLLAPWMAVGGLVLLPASLGAAILSGQFLGIERIVRRGLIALLVWMALLCVYGVLVDQFGDHVGAWSEDPPSGWLLIVVAGVAGTFPAVQRRLRRAAEHRLFRDVYDYRETLQQLGFEIVNLTSVQQIAEHVLARLGRTLDLSWAAISVDSDGERNRHYCWGKCPPLSNLAELGALETPLVAEGVTIGTLFVGPKRHDIDLLADDLSLIGTLAHLVGTAFHNRLLVRRLEAQVVAQAERQSALEALSEQLMRVQEEERRRLALDIHDDPLQRAILLDRRLRCADDPPDTAWVTRQMEDIIESLRAIHHYGNRDVPDDSYRTAASPLTAEQKAKMPLITHPIVRKHPVTGRKALYGVSGSSYGIVDMPDDEAVALLDELARHATQAQYVLRSRYGVFCFGDDVSCTGYPSSCRSQTRKACPARHVGVDHPRLGAVKPLHADDSASSGLAEHGRQDGAPRIGVDAHGVIDAPRRLIALRVAVLTVDDLVQRAEVVAEGIGLPERRHQLRREDQVASAAPQLLDVAAAGCKRPFGQVMGLKGEMRVDGTRRGGQQLSGGRGGCGWHDARGHRPSIASHHRAQGRDHHPGVHQSRHRPV